ncbi:MAG: Mrp/NBP35 family ATP-binding protein [Desulfurococcaceae archaeon]
MTTEKRISFRDIQKLLEDCKRRTEGFKHKILVISGKGGVGKTFFSSMLALALATRGKETAILDADIYGSSVPAMLGLYGLRHYANEKGDILPVTGPLGVKVVAINLMLDSPDTPIAWRGPLVSRAIIELLARVEWDGGDYLVIDMPPGTGDAALTIIQSLPSISGALVVTAPNTLSEIIVAKSINLLTSKSIRLLGIVENMAYFKCPICGSKVDLMGKHVGEMLASRYDIPLLGKIPFDPEVNVAVDSQMPYILAKPDSEVSKAILGIADKIITLLEHQDI